MMDGKVKKTGIYENLSKRRYEYWYVSKSGLKTMVSWLCWSAPQSVVEEWSNSQAK
ncbi:MULTISPECIES: hypothetical protein [unclassified Fictibacillus]|uniref:hypothetical protein n=2 Tax=unclassified Fictibacillus TaxID=2644029 RepID=UPI0008F450F0|nr:MULTISPECIES: hypothetical protein [unclassified Fictibacillus]MED2971395.1 hypothetical protein [Fictibacillus sp. B-59209]UZJ80205.1 hypothetical protein OKX00_07000 [Fictibacillus sp. KU28468]SFD55734.1 hypothetical protein SAMN05428981_101887 [Bacillus sp. OV194]